MTGDGNLQQENAMQIQVETTTASKGATRWSLRLGACWRVPCAESAIASHT